MARSNGQDIQTEVVLQGYNGNLTMLDSRQGSGDFAGSSTGSIGSGGGGIVCLHHLLVVIWMVIFHLTY